MDQSLVLPDGRPGWHLPGHILDRRKPLGLATHRSRAAADTLVQPRPAGRVAVVRSALRHSVPDALLSRTDPGPDGCPDRAAADAHSDRPGPFRADLRHIG